MRTLTSKFTSYTWHANFGGACDAGLCFWLSLVIVMAHTSHTSSSHQWEESNRPPLTSQSADKEQFISDSKRRRTSSCLASYSCTWSFGLPRSATIGLGLDAWEYSIYRPLAFRGRHRVFRKHFSLWHLAEARGDGATIGWIPLNSSEVERLILSWLSHSLHRSEFLWCVCAKTSNCCQNYPFHLPSQNSLSLLTVLRRMKPSWRISSLTGTLNMVRSISSPYTSFKGGSVPYYQAFSPILTTSLLDQRQTSKCSTDTIASLAEISIFLAFVNCSSLLFKISKRWQVQFRDQTLRACTEETWTS